MSEFHLKILAIDVIPSLCGANASEALCSNPRMYVIRGTMWPTRHPETSFSVCAALGGLPRKLADASPGNDYLEERSNHSKTLDTMLFPH